MTDDQESETLEAVFDESEAEAEEVEVKEEKGEEVETPATEKTDQVADDSSEIKGLKAALAAERRKRQEADKKLQEKTKPPDPVDDPEGFAEYQEAQRLADKVQTRIELSREIMLETNADFEEMEKTFLGLIGEWDDDGEFNVTDETLHKRFIEARSPARFAYNKAKEHLEIQKLRDPTYQAQREAELREKLRQEIIAELKLNKKGLSAVDVPNLTKAAASGSNSEPTEKEIEGLDELFE